MPGAGRQHTGSPGIVSFPFRGLPYELQSAILAHALADANDVSAVALLQTSRTTHQMALPILYEHITLSSIAQTLRFLAGAASAQSSRRSPHASLTRRLTFSIAGVPGGSTRGGRDSAPCSPDQSAETADGKNSERLLLAAQAILLCPALEHCSIDMFGVRHSTLLTSPAYLTKEASTFRVAMRQLGNLRSFSWVPPPANTNFVGFSVAVVDLAFAPLIEGLHTAAIDMTPDGRRTLREKGARDRYAHPLESITLHHCIFPMSTHPRDSLFQLLAQVHPDDEDWALFPRMQRLCIKTANNVEPRHVAFLALFWQLRLDPAMHGLLSDVETHQRAQCPDWDPTVVLSDAFVNRQVSEREANDAVADPFAHIVASGDRASRVKAYVSASRSSSKRPWFERGARRPTALGPTARTQAGKVRRPRRTIPTYVLWKRVRIRVSASVRSTAHVSVGCPVRSAWTSSMPPRAAFISRRWKGPLRVCRMCTVRVVSQGSEGECIVQKTHETTTKLGMPRQAGHVFYTMSVYELASRSCLSRSVACCITAPAPSSVAS